MQLRIISGGQTGADRAALDAAIRLGVPCGGWCPAGRKAEDGGIPPQYPLTELDKADYPARTRRNVLDADATLIVSFGPPDGGTALTLACCEREQKPYMLIDAREVCADAAGESVCDWLKKLSIRVLNVAGPRASKQPAIYDYVLSLVHTVIRRVDRQ